MGSAHRIVQFVLAVAYAHHLWFYDQPLTPSDATIVLFLLTGIGINEKLRQANPDTVVRAMAGIPGSLGAMMRNTYRSAAAWVRPGGVSALLTDLDSPEILIDEELSPGGRPGEET